MTAADRKRVKQAINRLMLELQKHAKPPHDDDTTQALVHGLAAMTILDKARSTP
jgi:hypothetical protein